MRLVCPGSPKAGNSKTSCAWFSWKKQSKYVFLRLYHHCLKHPDVLLKSTPFKTFKKKQLHTTKSIATLSKTDQPRAKRVQNWKLKLHPRSFGKLSSTSNSVRRRLPLNWVYCWTEFTGVYDNPTPERISFRRETFTVNGSYRIGFPASIHNARASSSFRRVNSW